MKEGVAVLLLLPAGCLIAVRTGRCAAGLVRNNLFNSNRQLEWRRRGTGTSSLSLVGRSLVRRVSVLCNGVDAQRI